MRSLVLTFWFIGLSLLSTTAPAQSLGCKKTDLGIDRVAHRVAGESTVVTGRVVSQCAQSTGVHIRISVFDKAGSILAVQDTWPASSKNMPPRGVQAFEAHFRGIKEPGKVTAVILETKVWPRR